MNKKRRNKKRVIGDIKEAKKMMINEKEVRRKRKGYSRQER